MGRVSYFIKTVEGTFPNWKQVIPTEFKHILNLTEKERDTLVELVKGVSRMASDTSSYVTVLMEKDTVKVSCQSAEKGSASETLTTKAMRFDDAPISMKFNPQFLISGLETGCSMRFNNDFSPVMFENSNGKKKEIVMPVRN